MTSTPAVSNDPIRRRVLAGVSLAAFSALVLAYLWWGRFDYHHSLLAWVTYGFGSGIVFSNHLLLGDRLDRMGLRLDNFRRAIVGFGGFTVGAGLALTLAGFAQGNPFLAPPAIKVGVYAGWALVQQHFLQNFLRLRSEDLLGVSRLDRGSERAWRELAAFLLAAFFFSVYHLPNVFLMLFTFVGAFVWCFLFRRIPNLLAAALSHVLLALVLLGFFRASLLDQFGVGRPGYRYDYYGGGVKVAGGRDASGRPFVATLPGPDKGVSARVRIFDPDGEPRAEWVAFADLDFSGELAVGDLGYGPGDEIVVVPGPGAGNPPLVRVFDPGGKRLTEFTVESLDDGYGLWVSAACGRIYLCPGPGPDAPPRALEFSAAGELLMNWLFDGEGLFNGVRATALCQGSSDPDPILFWPTDIAVNPSTIFVLDRGSGRVARRLDSLRTTFGVQAVVVHIGARAALAVAPGPLSGYPALIHVIDLDGNKLEDFAAGSEGAASCGATLGALDVDGDGRDEILVGEGSCAGQPSSVRIFRLDGTLLRQWIAYR